ncbi:DUF4439 domain-containing protein [Arthrobacter sp. TMS1-12-1]
MTKRAGTDGRQAGAARSGSPAGRLARRAAGLVALFAVMLLVVGVGLGVRSPEPRERAFSATEQAQLDAEQRYRAAADQARSTAADPALAPEAAAELAAAAADLDVQADAVALPRSPGPEGGAADAATTDPTPGGPTPGGTTADGPTADAPALLALLRDSALRSLRDAAGAEPGPGRVLAASGVNQWRHALQLGHALGMDPGLPAPDALSAADLAAGTGPFAAVAGPASPAAASPTPPAECAGTPLRPDADRRALLEARTAEDQARYAYEVAAALLPEPARALGLAATHRAAADAATARLAALCVPAAPAPAGYALGPDFRADPLTAMRSIEQDHAELYAGLIATVGPGSRAWAITSFSAAAQRSVDAGTPLDALPGLAGSAPAATPAPASTDAPPEQPGG